VGVGRRAREDFLLDAPRSLRYNEWPPSHLDFAMASLNKVMLIGNLTRDPEVRYTPKGQAVTDVSLAMNRRYMVDNEWREEVTYVDVTFWAKQAETIGQYCKKGRPLFVEARLQLDSWEDKTTGKKVYKLRVVGENFQFLGPRDSGESTGAGSSSQTSAPRPTTRSSAPSPSPAASSELDHEDEDQVPF
jgi:single-strand DNA-binding protein